MSDKDSKRGNHHLSNTSPPDSQDLSSASEASYRSLASQTLETQSRDTTEEDWTPLANEMASSGARLARAKSPLKRWKMVEEKEAEKERLTEAEFDAMERERRQVKKDNKVIDCIDGMFAPTLSGSALRDEHRRRVEEDVAAFERREAAREREEAEHAEEERFEKGKDMPGAWFDSEHDAS